MTYKQVKLAVQALLENHAMIKKVMFNTPQEWMYRGENPEFPLCCFAMNGGALEPGYKVMNLQIWFLDRAGVDGEFEVDVVSDQVEIANDIVALLKQSWVNDWLIDENVIFEVLLEKFDDFISGCRIDVILKTQNDYDTCAIPYTV